VCGDIELNPGPANFMSVLTTRLDRIGLNPVNIVGDGNCFFCSVSHQLYRTEDRHPQIRALAIQHLINRPEYFIEYNTENSWLQYLQNMAKLGTWADHIIIQAVANSNNLIIHITETAANFTETTVVTSIHANEPGVNIRHIYIGHLDEMHYVSSSPQSLSEQRNSYMQSLMQTTNEHQKAKLVNSQFDGTQTQSKRSVKLQNRKNYMREYMKNRRMDNEFKSRENKRKKTYNKKYKILNPENLKISSQKATAKYRQSKPEKCKESVATYRQSNPKSIKESIKKANATYRQSNPEKVQQSSKISNKIYKQKYSEKVKDTQKRK
jgi:tRNA nucleotidyltransferase/poly(A) polymerase